MKLGQAVMLVGTEGFMPPMGSVGEIVEAFDGEDYGVDFPKYPCPVPPEPYWYVPPRYLMPINRDEQPTTTNELAKEPS
jgi:hypothetical protein